VVHEPERDAVAATQRIQRGEQGARLGGLVEVAQRHLPQDVDVDDGRPKVGNLRLEPGAPRGAVQAEAGPDLDTEPAVVLGRDGGVVGIMPTAAQQRAGSPVDAARGADRSLEIHGILSRQVHGTPGAPAGTKLGLAS
jgi:hypothetical protein